MSCRKPFRGGLPQLRAPSAKCAPSTGQQKCITDGHSRQIASFAAANNFPPSPLPLSTYPDDGILAMIKVHGVAEGVHTYHGKVAKAGGTTVADQYVLTVVYKNKPSFHLVQKTPAGVFAVNGKAVPGGPTSVAEVSANPGISSVPSQATAPRT